MLHCFLWTISVLRLHHDTELCLQQVDKYFKMKPGSIGDLDFYLGADRNLLTSGLDSGSSWLDGVNGILMQQEPDSPKQDYWNRRAIASLANTLITVVEPVPTPLLSSMLLLQL
jgi:hypothetical protein